MNVFYNAATNIQNKPTLEWIKTGKKVVGYTCSYVPAEIFHAAGILPVRLRGIQTDGTDIGDAYYGPFVCSFPKCVLQLAGKGLFSFLDGAIVVPGCDAMRRLDECWRKAGEDLEGIVPSFFYYLDVPNKSENHGMDWFVQEIRNLIQSVEAHFGVKITNRALHAAINEYNKGRRLLKTMDDLRSKEGTVISGTDAFAAVVAGVVMPRKEYTEHLEKWVTSLKQEKPVNNGKKRLMVIGSISDEIELIELIEKDTDALVVAENLCFGLRYENNQIPEEGDPVVSLAHHYLGKSICPRMYGKYKERLSVLKAKIDRAKVDGIIMQNIRFCDLHGAENSLFERDLEAEGIPCLKIEREYGPLTESGRLKMRINAFLERIS